jgi:UDP-N-acetylmuramate--alanine ligase
LQSVVERGAVVGIAGTHGKTTTTAMTTAALAACGADPTGIVGGRVAEWGGNVRFGGDTLFVVEADEYDKAFLALRPTLAVVNNVEADHLECYGSVSALEDAFAEFASRAERVLVGWDDEGARRVAGVVEAPLWRVGTSPDAEVRLTHIHTAERRSVARLSLPDGRTQGVELVVPGVHNLRNAAMALATVYVMGLEVARAVEALAHFSGVGRRFDVLGTRCGVTVVDDYAHHPTELGVTIAAARQRFPSARVVAVFQPHLYSRTQTHGEALGAALGAADVAVVTPIFPAREQPIPGITGELVVDAARRAGGHVEWVSNRQELVNRIIELVHEGDVVLTIGAGDITDVGPQLLHHLAESAA